MLIQSKTAENIALFTDQLNEVCVLLLTFNLTHLVNMLRKPIQTLFSSGEARSCG